MNAGALRGSTDLPTPRAIAPRSRRRRPRADRRRLGPRSAARAAPRRTSTSRSTACRADRAARGARALRTGQHRRRELHGLQGRATSTSSLPRRESKTGRGHRASRSPAIPIMSIDEAARRRDFTVNAIAWDPLTGEYLDPFDGRGDLAARACCAWSIRGRSATTACGCCAAMQFAARFELEMDDATTRRLPPASPLDDLPAERIWGEIEKLLLLAPRPSIGFALGARARRRRAAVPRTAGAGRLPAGAGVASRRRRLGPHADGHRPGAHAHRRPRPHPQQVTVMLGAVCHDLGKPPTTAFSRRPHPIDRSRTGRASRRRRACSTG